MSNKNVDDILQQGIFGAKELKPAERKKYLGTFRERVVAVLTQGQIREKTIYRELIKRMKTYNESTLLLNADIDYEYLKKYVDAAVENKIPYKLVMNKESETEIGLVLAVEDAIDLEDIALTRPIVEKPAEKPKKRSFIYKMMHWVKGKSQN